MSACEHKRKLIEDIDYAEDHEKKTVMIDQKCLDCGSPVHEFFEVSK